MPELMQNISRRAVIGGAATLGLVCGIPVSAFATPAEDKQAEASAALASLNALQEKLDYASADYNEALIEQAAAQERMDEAQGRIDQANERIQTLQGKLSTRARSMYRSGSISLLDLLLGATSFHEFVNNWELLNDMNENDASMVSETKALRQEVEDEKAVYVQQKAIADDKEHEAAQVKDEAETMVAEQAAIYNSLSAEAESLLAEERAAQEAAEAAAAAAAQSSSSGGGSSSDDDWGGSSGNYDDAPAYDVVTGNAVVDRAYSKIGCWYSWGACGPNVFDCSGLVSYCLLGECDRIGTTYTFMTWPEVGAANAQPGDVVTNDHHCGIYIGGGQMIHAPYTGAQVCISSVHSNMIYVRCP